MGLIFFRKEVLSFSVTCFRSSWNIWFNFSLIFVNSLETFNCSFTILSLNSFWYLHWRVTMSRLNLVEMCSFLYYNWSYLKLIFRLHVFLRKNSDCSLLFFCVFMAFEFLEVITTVCKNLFCISYLWVIKLIFVLNCQHESMLEHWLWSISMSLTSKLLHPDVSFWFVNSNLIASQLNLPPFIWNIIPCTVSRSGTLFSTSSLRWF